MNIVIDYENLLAKSVTEWPYQNYGDKVIEALCIEICPVGIFEYKIKAVYYKPSYYCGFNIDKDKWLKLREEMT